MSQNIRAAGASGSAQGSSSKLLGSGMASTSLSCTRLKPSIERAVERHALLEGVLQLGRGDGEALELAEHVGEPEPDEPDAPLLDRAQHVVLLAFHGR